MRRSQVATEIVRSLALGLRLGLLARRRARAAATRSAPPYDTEHQDGLRAGLPVDHRSAATSSCMLTELVIKEIEQRTPYKVVGTPEEADTILEGTINFADKNIVVENPFNLPAQLNATVNGDGQAGPTTRRPSREELDRRSTRSPRPSTSSPKSARPPLTAFYRTCQKLATQIVDMMEQPW